MSAPLTRTIELDCPPGPVRPGDLIEGVITGTILPLKPEVSRFFGNWTWDYSEIPERQWEEIQPILAERINALYDKGVIRYGSW